MCAIPRGRRLLNELVIFASLEISPIQKPHGLRATNVADYERAHAYRERVPDRGRQRAVHAKTQSNQSQLSRPRQQRHTL